MLMALWLQCIQPQQPSARTTDASPKLLPFLTCYRASVIFLTCVAILAVDFQIFPRRFAKTEVMGYGLMDLGAGSFVVAAGLLPSKPATQHWKRILPLLSLGIIRFVANKGLDYQEHMSEYGIHWNFFLTLAVVTPLASLLSSHTPSASSVYSWLLPILLMGCYQYALDVGLQDYIETAPRQCTSYENVLCNMFAANREGILGCIGYLSLYLASQAIGRLCLWNKNISTRERRILLFGTAVILWVLHALLARFVTASRRSTNATFCVWTLAHNVLLLSLFEMGTVCTPPIMNAINRHGLSVFMVANLLTGLVNLSFNTLQADDGIALAILLTYLGAVAGFALILDYALSRTRETKKE